MSGSTATLQQPVQGVAATPAVAVGAATQAETPQLVTFTPEQLSSFQNEIAVKSATEAIRQFAAEQVPGFMKSAAQADGNISPYFYIKGRPNPYDNFDTAIAGKEDFRGLALARIVRIKSYASIMNRDAISVAKEFEGVIGGELGAFCTKALSAGVIGAGGDLMQTAYGEFLPLLRATAIVLASGAVEVPMEKGNMTMARQTGASQASYSGENRVVVASQLSTGAERLTARKLRALTIISNDLLRYAGAQADVIVRQDLLMSASLRMDLAGIRGDGVQDTPRGVRYWTALSNVFNSSGTTVAQITADLQKMMRLTKEANVPQTGFVWWISPAYEAFLKGKLNDLGMPVWKAEMMTGKLEGLPYYVSNQIPSNLTGSNYTEVTLVAMPMFQYANTLDMEIEAVRYAAYDDNGTVKSGLSQDQTAVTLVAEHDFFLKYATAAAVMTNVATHD